jgi:hypothetical protein
MSSLGRSYDPRKTGSVPLETELQFESTFVAQSGFDPVAAAAALKNLKDKDEAPKPEKLEPAKPFVPFHERKDYTNLPIYEDHLLKSPDTVKLGPEEVQVFDLPKQAAELNALMAGAEPETAPQIMVSHRYGPEWNKETASWHILVTFRRVYYRRLL